MNVKWTKLSEVLLESAFNTNATEALEDMSLAECTIITVSQGYEHCRTLLEKTAKKQTKVG